MANIYYRTSGFRRAIVQYLGSEQTGSTATDTATFTAHGLAVGDAVAFTALGGASGISLLTRYYVINVGSADTFKVSATYGGSAVSIGSGSSVKMVPLTTTRLYLAQKAVFNASTATKTWEGDNLKIEQESLEGLKVVLDLDAVPASAHPAIFGHTAVGVTLPGGMTNAYGFGGGNDVGGKSVGLLLEADAVKSTDGVETSVVFARWLPQGTLTLLKAGDIQTGQKLSVTQYNFTATRTAVDLFGAAIPNASSGGDFWFDGDRAA